MFDVAVFIAAMYICFLFLSYFIFFFVRAIDNLMLGEWLKFFIDILILVGPVACGYVAYILCF